MKIKEIRKLKPEDLDKRLAELRLELMKELGNVRMGRAVKNPGKIKVLRRDIARILTIKKEFLRSSTAQMKEKALKRGK